MKNLKKISAYFQEMLKKAYYLYKREGFLVIVKSLFMYALFGRKYFQNRNVSMEKQYAIWVQNHEKFEKQNILLQIQNFKLRPKISIIVPVYNIDAKWLDACITSVISQFYEDWELCLHDDASTKIETIHCLKKWQKKDRRIHVSFATENKHISAASNAALKAATGEFVAFLDNDDVISPDALFEIVRYINNNPEVDILYSDEDMIDEKGKRSNPFFKPGWSPDLLLSMNYITHFCVYKKTLIDAIDGLREGYEGSQDYDLILRASEKAKCIIRIPKILYHWRQLPSSTASGSGSKNYAYDAAKRALEDTLVRRNIQGEVVIESPGLYRIKRDIIVKKKVSIIIPFRDEVNVLRTCIESICKKTEYSNWEVLLVNNQSIEAETLAYLQEITERSQRKIRVIQYDKPFNFSDMNNYAVSQCDGEYILFLNNDTEVVNNDWLTSLVEHIQRDEVGAVGARLLYPNNTIQHGGVILFEKGIATHAFKSFPRESSGYRNFLSVTRNYSAVTAACMITRRDLFLNVSGFDADNLSVAYNDVDYCLKVLEQGKLVVYTPYTTLYHYESLSRGDDNDLERSNPEKFKRVLLERNFMKTKWMYRLRDDIYYNPNLTRHREDFSLDF